MEEQLDCPLRQHNTHPPLTLTLVPATSCASEHVPTLPCMHLATWAPLHGAVQPPTAWLTSSTFLLPVCTSSSCRLVVAMFWANCGLATMHSEAGRCTVSRSVTPTSTQWHRHANAQSLATSCYMCSTVTWCQHMTMALAQLSACAKQLTSVVFACSDDVSPASAILFSAAFAPGGHNTQALQQCSNS